MKRALFVLASLATLFLCACALWCAAHWTFVERVLTYPNDTPVTSVEWYEPKELVHGAAQEDLAVLAPEEVGLELAELERAAAWAAEKNSCALLVLRRGGIVFERYWHGWSSTRPTNSFSLSKTLLGLLAGTAVERGELDTADAIERFVPEWRSEPRGRITVEQLLRMQSGLRYDDEREDPFSDMAQVHLAADILPTILALPLECEPGTRFRYSNLDSQLLGLVIERACGGRFAELLAERLWRPLGARDAAVWLDREGGTAKTYCCVFATARDWARVGELMRNGGRANERQIVAADWIERMTSPSPQTDRYGMHVWLRSGGDAPDHFYLDGKSKQRVYVIPSLEAVIVRLGENASSWDDLELPRRIAAAARDR